MGSCTTHFVIKESSQVGEARRASLLVAERAGFNEADGGRLALVVTELATNLVKHTGGLGGDLLLQTIREPGRPTRVQVLSLDRGPGIPDVARSLRDGFSTTSTAGEGLGMVRRTLGCFDVYSQAGKGAAIFGEMVASPDRDSVAPPPAAAPLFSFGGINVAYQGETVCGDSWSVRDSDQGLTVLGVDGLGHGPFASEAAEEAVKAFEKSHDQPLDRLFETIHRAMRSTRGGALSVARVSRAGDSVTFAGIGNFSGSIHSPTGSSHLVTMNGIVGSDIRKIKQFKYPFGPRSVMVLHSDGLSTKTTLEGHPGLNTKSAALIAGVLYRDFTRHRDDATAVVVKGSGWNDS